MHACSLTVAICSYNRARYLEDALRSFAAVAPSPREDVELLVIDNDSADQTRAVVERARSASSVPVRYAFEERRGLSAARNRALALAAGRWIWFVDDDVHFSPGWLAGAFAAIESFPGAAAIAGRVVPAFETDRPRWLPDSILSYYGKTSLGEEPRLLAGGEYPVGANVAFRCKLLEEMGTFREDLGRVGDLLLSAEETELALRLREHGHSIAYAPEVTVRHRVPPERATMSWLRRRAYWGGISHAIVQRTRTDTSRRGLALEAASLVRDVARSVLANGAGVEDQLDYAWRIGMARQYLVDATRSDRVRPCALVERRST